VGKTGRKPGTTDESQGDYLQGVSLHLDEGDAILSKICDSLKRDELRIKVALGSAGVVVGHGTQIVLGGKSSEKIPSVQVNGKSLSLTDWWELGRRSVCILHVCFGGNAASVFLGDMGGLPGVILRRATGLLLAPVAEVPVPDDGAGPIEVLNRHLFAEEGDEEIGARYLDAIDEEPSVALYNLYGFADKRVLWRARKLA
jgi:hypothetical protein